MRQSCGDLTPNLVHLRNLTLNLTRALDLDLDCAFNLARTSLFESLSSVGYELTEFLMLRSSQFKPESLEQDTDDSRIASPAAKVFKRAIMQPGPPEHFVILKVPKDNNKALKLGVGIGLEIATWEDRYDDTNL
ncbi:uncharacterized protein DS421_10g309330 [Arachis hypogaea]|nr:uncharacterized protein DS421_10g309330 [Arachis hypogaea]